MTGLPFRSDRFTRRSAEGYVRIIWILLLGAFLLFPFLTDHGHTGLTCQFHKMTGLSCPTCGMSRSLYELVHLHMAASFRFHLFGPVVYLVALLLFMKLFLEMVLGTGFTIVAVNKTASRVILWAGTLWVLYWLVRMGVELWG
jgi:hypothetical protein